MTRPAIIPITVLSGAPSDTDLAALLAVLLICLACPETQAPQPITPGSALWPRPSGYRPAGMWSR
ncbi:acyl-CoA carboxylase epsilon subunit-like protein [Nocardia tenerifensis]|uniref:Acyl-CoA carboxylase epsilon subunit-like protein n=1 Tax=Nocardia tenerifensis TaxID=228006 RepID=A0A318KGS4_9NOCA|nr:acyl-CoA carboxylase epsilon subunit [Nocardia tenerifensis]PXX71462.1 acyl-CoA carboxylase epsilon subunit-like protein [Nocardia tenerifensis]